jgi:Cation transporting ATPase, C-terminus
MSVILILSIDLGCDLLSAFELAFEPPEADIMLRKSRNASTYRLFNTRLTSFSYLQIDMFQALAGFLAFPLVLLDFSWRRVL